VRRGAQPEKHQVRVEALARRLGVRPPDVRRSAEPVSPHVLGILSPILIVPAWLEGQGDAEEAFLLHELAHVRRRDPWILVFLVGMETVFFFWPPVRWAAARLRGAREAACDATAVERGPLTATAYARLRVGAARSVAARPSCSLVLSGAVTTRLEERIDFLLRRRAGALVPGGVRRRCRCGSCGRWPAPSGSRRRRAWGLPVPIARADPAQSLRRATTTVASPTARCA
jgi:beta-lactamase regulating signal transducer with metallopeptidase domain